MIVFWMVAVGLAVAAAIGYPLFLSNDAVRAFRPASSRAKVRRDLREQKGALVLALRELDFDFEMGKLSKEDYLSIREKYQAKAVDVMKRLDEMESLWKTAQAKVDLELGTPSTSTQLYCGQCGRALSSEAKFCGVCGTEQKQKAYA